MTHDEFLGTRHFPALDGLRAVAALIVIAFHFAGPPAQFLSGWLGVHVFFVLSGFLITTLALREESRDAHVSLKRFWTRRLFRIVPAYLVVLGLTVAHELFVSRADFVRMVRLLPYFVTFNAEFAPPTNYLHTWTIGIEQKFYLVWPVLAFALALTFARRLALTLSLAVIALVLMTVTGIDLPVHYVVLLMGCALAIVMHDPRGYELVRRLMRPWPAAIVIVGFLVLHLAVPTMRQQLSEPQTIALYGMAVTVIVPPMLAPGWTRRFLSVAPLIFLGKRSYSLYLVQFLAAQIVAHFVPALGYVNGTFGVVTALTAIVLASAVYAAVELPFIGFGKRLTSRADAGLPARRALVVEAE